MPQPRSMRTLLFLCVFLSLSTFTAISPWMLGMASRPESSKQIAQTSHLPAAPEESFVADSIPLPRQGLWGEVAALDKKPAAAEPEQETASPVEAAAEPVEAAGKIGSQVVEAAAIEPPLELVKDESGPSLAGKFEAPQQPAEEKPAVQPAPQTVQHADPVPPLQEAVTRPGEISKLALLPDWLRRLPDMVASIPMSDPTPETAESEEATEPESEETPEPAVTSTAKSEQAPRLKVDDSWYAPKTLIKSLNELESKGPASKWAMAALRQIRALGPAIAGNSNEATTILNRLDELNRETVPLATKLSDQAFTRKWLAVGYAITRRIDIWRQIVRLKKAGDAESVARDLDGKKLGDCLAKIEAIIGDSAEGQAWRGFLLIDALKKQCVEPAAPDERLSRDVAALGLIRLTQTPLTPLQQKFVSSAPVAALRMELWRWAAQPIGIADLLRDIERYERTRLPSDARRLAVDCQSLLASSVEARRQLADRVEVHYRNANFRFAVAEELLNSLIPDQKLEYAQLNDTVLGRPTQGETLSQSKLAVRMVPDPNHISLALEVTGEIAALTTTDAGPAQFHNESESRYIARKRLEIDLEGISLWKEVDIDVQNESRLNGVDTSADPIPLFSWVARKIAQSQHDLNKSAATQETKQKIADKVTERINTETRQRFSEVVDRLNERVFDPLNSLALDPQLIDANTTEKRFTMRLRLGGEDQLGSHTPRPQAPSDSLVSLQIHESVINNGIQRLQLDGRTFTLLELSRHVAACLNCPTPWPTNPDNADVKIKFAERNSIMAHFQNGEVVLTISVARLSKSPRKWSDFQVVAIYKPEVRGRSAQLVREGTIQLLGAKNMGSRVVLLGVFGRALSRKAPWELMPEKIINQPKLQQTAITQFWIDDGWIGLSLGPKPTTTASRPRIGSR